MATRTITETDCDRCDSKNVPVGHYKIKCGSTPCPAGGMSSDDYFEFDLCMACMSRLLWGNYLAHISKAEAEGAIKDMGIKRARRT